MSLSDLACQRVADQSLHVLSHTIFDSSMMQLQLQLMLLVLMLHTQASTGVHSL